MRRREFITLLGGATAAWPLAARAQQAAKVYRLGQLSGGTAASRIPLLAAFMRGMHDFGYVEGQNLVIEHRYAEGRFEVLPTLGNCWPGIRTFYSSRRHRQVWRPKRRHRRCRSSW
jgi:putative tryptophan/tyrosine transport system substrate-binding protein